MTIAALLQKYLLILIDCTSLFVEIGNSNFCGGKKSGLHRDNKRADECSCLGVRLVAAAAYWPGLLGTSINQIQTIYIHLQSCLHAPRHRDKDACLNTIRGAGAQVELVTSFGLFIHLGFQGRSLTLVLTGSSPSPSP